MGVEGEEFGGFVVRVDFDVLVVDFFFLESDLGLLDKGVELVCVEF